MPPLSKLAVSLPKLNAWFEQILPPAVPLKSQTVLQTCTWLLEMT